jgi:hypothetical protein
MAIGQIVKNDHKSEIPGRSTAHAMNLTERNLLFGNANSFTQFTSYAERIDLTICTLRTRFSTLPLTVSKKFGNCPPLLFA